MGKLLRLVAVLVLASACGGGPTGICYRPEVIQTDTVWSMSANGADSTLATAEWRICNGNGGILR